MRDRVKKDMDLMRCDAPGTGKAAEMSILLAKLVGRKMNVECAVLGYALATYSKA